MQTSVFLSGPSPVRVHEHSFTDVVSLSHREKLRDKTGYAHMTEKQRSAKISRQLRLLRDHGLIKKLPRQKRYIVTQKGRELTAALDALSAASTKQLMELAA